MKKRDQHIVGNLMVTCIRSLSDLFCGEPHEVIDDMEKKQLAEFISKKCSRMAIEDMCEIMDIVKKNRSLFS